MKKGFYYVFLSIISLSTFTQCTPKKEASVWDKADEIVKTIGTISFPEKEYNIVDFGAVADGVTSNTQIINEVIKKCSEEGGGKVIIPAGKFFTAAIHLEDNVNLHISEGATLLFSTEPTDYLPLVKSSWEGVLCYNYSPLIYALGKTNIGITGKGTINGMSKDENWWKWKGKKEHGWKEGIACQEDSIGRPLLLKMNQQKMPVEERQMGEGHYLRPHFIQVYECKNVLIEDITIEDSPFWVIHPMLSENIIVRGVTINSHGPNNDGCDPESCINVLIENCLFNTGDDCIALKSGRNEDGRTMATPVENVVIRNCMMKDGHGGVVIGSEISGGAKNIFAENCKMNSPELDRAIRIKTSALRGGVIEKIYVRNIEVGQVKQEVIRINCKYEPNELGDSSFLPLVQDVYIENVTAEKTKYGLNMNGIEDTVCIKNIYISNCTFNGVQKEDKIEFVEGLHLENVKNNK